MYIIWQLRNVNLFRHSAIPAPHAIQRISMDIEISQQAGVPLYARIAEGIAKAIEAGTFKPGDKLPTHVAMATRLDVTPLTVSRAYRVLTRRGIVRQKRGSGTFIESAALTRLTVAKGDRLKHIVVVVGKDHLAKCHRDQIRLMTEMLEGLDVALGRRRVRFTYTADFTRQTLGHLKQGCAVLLRHCDKVDATFLRELEKRDVPVLALLNSPPQFVVPAVSFDMFQAVRLGVEHLLACGYTRLGYIGPMGSPDYDPDGILGVKFLEFANVMYRAGLDFQMKHVHEARNEPGLAYAAMQKIIRGGDLPDAFFVETDYMAMQAIAALHDAGLSVPDDVGIASMDDVADAAHFEPPLTTVRTPQYEIGLEAGRQLLAWMKDRTPLASKVLLSQLQVRKSTATCLPKAAELVSSPS